MSYGGNGENDGLDLGFEVPEQQILREKIESALPDANDLSDKVVDRIQAEIESAGNLVRDNQMMVIGSIGEALGAAQDGQDYLKSKLLPVVNNYLAASQVPALEINRSADLLFGQILADRSGQIDLIKQRIPQFGALLYWTWENKVKPQFSNLTKDDFKEAADLVWKDAVKSAKSGGAKNIASLLKETEQQLAAREPICPPGEQWIPSGGPDGKGYCTPISDPLEDTAPQVSSEPQKPTIIGADGLQIIEIGTDTPAPLEDAATSYFAQHDQTEEEASFGPYGSLDDAIRRHGPGGQIMPFGSGCLKIPQPPVNRSQLPPLPVPYDWWSDSNGLVRITEVGESRFAYAWNNRDRNPWNILVCWDEEETTTADDCPPCPPETEEEIEDSYCPPPWCPTIELNCSTGIAPEPVAPPLDCNPADPVCAEENALPQAEEEEDCEQWFVFYSEDDKGCYTRCDNINPIRPHDRLIDSADTKADADRMIEVYCKSKGVREIYYPTITPRPYATPVTFPSMEESYFCKIEEWVKTYVEPILGGSSDRTSYEAGQDFLRLMGINKQGRIPTLDNLLGAFTGPGGFVLSTINNLLSTLYKNGATWIVQVIQWAQQSRKCFSSAWTANFYKYTFWGLLEQYISSSFGFLKTNSQYRVQAECPQLLPELDPSIEMYLSGKIDEKELQALVKLNNYCFDPVDKLVASREARYTTNELLNLRMRGQLDEKQYDYEIRRNGWLERDAGSRLWDLHRAIPPMSDLIRMMIRDVGDPKIVEKYGYEQQFEDKWQGNLKKWSEEQGINEYIAKAYWAAHWNLPSPTQLFEMMHRLSRLDPSDDAYTDSETIQEAMRVNDWPDYWITRFKAISYRRLTRVDVRRAFMIGSIKRPQVIESYQQLGYTKENAGILADFAEDLLVNRLEKSKDVRLYKSGVIDKADTLRRLTENGATFEQADKITTEVDNELKAELADECAKGIKKQFVGGTMDRLGATSKLVTLKIPLARVNMLIEGWQCERDSVDRKPSTTQLCTWKQNGLINDDQFMKSLKELGWDAVEIKHIIDSCDIKIADKAAKQAAQAARQQQAVQRRAAADQRRIQREAQANQRRGQAEDEKRQRQQQRAAKAREAAVKANLKRQTIRLKAADKVAAIYDIPLDDAILEVNNAYSTIRRNYGFNANRATEVIRVGVDTIDKKNPEDFVNHLTTVADSYS